MRKMRTCVSHPLYFVIYFFYSKRNFYGFLWWLISSCRTNWYTHANIIFRLYICDNIATTLVILFCWNLMIQATPWWLGNDRNVIFVRVDDMNAKPQVLAICSMNHTLGSGGTTMNDMHLTCQVLWILFLIKVNNRMLRHPTFLVFECKFWVKIG